jgi:hypothetical protein
MIPEQNICNFLENFDKNNKIHLKTFELFNETCGSVLKDISMFIVNSGKNVENLNYLIHLLKSEESNLLKDELNHENNLLNKENILSNKSRFNNYLNNPIDLQKERNSDLFEMSMKKLKLIDEEFIGNSVNKLYNSSNDHLNSESSIDFGIPGLGEASDECENNIAPKVNDNIKNKNAIIKENKIFNNPPIPETTGTTTLDTVFYKSILTDLKIKNTIEIPADPFYLFPVLQCKLCGLRFGSNFTAEFGLHLDDHRRFTNALGEKVILRREFFNSKRADKMEKLDLNFEGKVENVIWEKDSPLCLICKKIIKKVWDDKLENWVLDEGTRVNDKEVAHRKCVY